MGSMKNSIYWSCLMSCWGTVRKIKKENIKDPRVEIIGATQKKKKTRRGRKKNNVKVEQKQEEFDEVKIRFSDEETGCSESDLKNDHKSKDELIDSLTKQKRSKLGKCMTSILNETDCEPMKSKLKKRKRDEISKN